ncbi:uncharacterized protein B0H64DRAFT_395162 [Chaetomium fimeti]|uniref:Nephrocystin 3-like N-terminal domain-containing protein n=1 Tax=Chaetomium fimeti TaxID=1854472 RepID=A0AAE0HF59_9PEZI|nr:hypothetical protein B0H64DRAFT_395162 [Chaetomium fimeti]
MIVFTQISLFVEVCDYIMECRGGIWPATVHIFKRTFVEDERVKEMLQKMESELQKEGLETAVQTYDLVAKAEEQNNETSWRKTIAGVLGFGLGDLADSVTPYNKSLGKLYKEPAKGTCLWIQENEDFQAWRGAPVAAATATANTSATDWLLLLEGGARSGKSRMMASLFTTLNAQEAERGVVACCFGRDLLASAGTDLDAEGVCGLVVRSILWQFASKAPNKLARSMAATIASPISKVCTAASCSTTTA